MGNAFLETAVSHGLLPHHRVLDIGCGAGRFAVALAQYLDEKGSYVGIDVDRHSIHLCRRYIGSQLSAYQFSQVA